MDGGISPDNDWEAEDAARTLQRADEIKKDAGLLERAKKAMEQKIINNQAELETLNKVGKKEEVNTIGKGTSQDPLNFSIK